MRVLLGYRIQCGPAQMARLLNIMSGTEHMFQHLTDVANDYAASNLFVFRSGAKLGRRGRSAWYIYGYQAGNADGKAAMSELRAADHVRQAIEHMNAVQDIMQPNRKSEFRVTYKGLWGEYPSGQRTPSVLNNLN